MSEWSNFVDRSEIVPAFGPLDGGLADNNGVWVNMSKYKGALIIVQKAAGPAGQAPVLTVQQAKDNTGGSAKPLNYGRVRSKVGATVPAIPTEFLWIGGAWVARTDAQQNPDAVTNNYTDATSAAAVVSMWEIPIQSRQMDSNGKFIFMNLKITDIGAGVSLISATYVLTGARFAEFPPQSALT